MLSLQQCLPSFDSISSRRRTILVLLGVLVFVFLLTIPRSRSLAPVTVHDLTVYTPIRATLPATDKKGPDPIRWLEENSNNRYSVTDGYMSKLGFGSGKPRAALISLVRNSELEGMMQSMRQLEYRWNSKYLVTFQVFPSESTN